MADYLNVIRGELLQRSFTNEGANYFEKVVRDFSQELEVKSKAQADAETVPGMKLEIGPGAIRLANFSFFSRSPIRPSGLRIAGNVGEYLCAIVAGFSGAELSQWWGTPVLVISSVLGVILIVARMLSSRET